MITDNNTINKFNINFFIFFLSKKNIISPRKIRGKTNKKVFLFKTMKKNITIIKKKYLIFLFDFG